MTPDLFDVLSGPIGRTPFALVAVMVASTATAAAQQASVQPDSARAQIHTTLRAFYFNLAHQDLEALTADILAAKVVAHRPAPAALLTAADPPRGVPPGGAAAAPSSVPDDPVACSSERTALVDQATITLDGDWAELSVPRCTPTSAGADEFRLIRFEDRWRFVYIHLFEAPVNVSTDR
jgi:hypothetical protein